MQRLAKNLVRFLKAEDGPTAVEYAVMLALIIVVCIGAVTTLGNNASAKFTSVGNSLGGTGSNTRWSADGKLVGTVQADGFAVFRTDDLSLYARLPARFPSDIAFIGSKRLAIGTWSGGSIAELPAAMRTT